MFFDQLLVKTRHPLISFLLGGMVAGIFILLEIALWRWLASSPFLILPMAILIASFVGGGLVAGLTTTFILTAYTSTFPQAHSLMHQLMFLVTGVIGTLLVDVIQGKTRELVRSEARSEEAELLKFAADAVKIGIWEWHLESNQATWDKRMHTIYGIQEGSFTGGLESWRNHCHPEDKEYVDKALDAALRGDQDYLVEFRIINPDGTLKNIRAHGLVIRDSKGHPLRMFGINQDVTEEKKTLKNMEKLKAYFEAALAQSTAGIVIADAPDGKLRFVNPSALKIVEGDEAQLVKDVDINRYNLWNIADLDGSIIPNEDLPLTQAIRFGHSSNQKLIFVRPSGEKRVALVQTAPVRDEEGAILSGIAVFADITEQEQLLQDLKTARETAEVAMRAKAKFLDIAAHELRTPVTAASLLTQLTQRQVESERGVDKTILHRLRVQLDRLSRLVVDLLEVSKLDRGVLELHYEIIDFRSLVQECASTFAIQFPDRVFNFFLPDDPVDISLDPIRVSEVLSNLLDNAIKFSPNDSPIDLELVNTPDFVRFAIRDYGPGLSDEGQKKLFTAFERGETSEKAPGLGLGLFICRGIINLHGGTISVRSLPGKGSTFYFDLPRKQTWKKTAS